LSSVPVLASLRSASLSRTLSCRASLAAPPDRLGIDVSAKLVPVLFARAGTPPQFLAPTGDAICCAVIRSSASSNKTPSRASTIA
jgi:hypothetical protein